MGMAKGNGKKGAPGNCPGRESFLRMNYLYQLSSLSMCNQDILSNMYCKLLKSIAKKCVQRLDHTIKRTICKKCNQRLKYDTSRVKLKKKRVTYICRKCDTKRSYLLDKKYKLWSERSEALQ